MNKLFLLFASIAGALAVIAGALLAHQLKQRMPLAAMEVYEVAVRYQFYHVFALIAVAILSERIPGSRMNLAGSFFIAGILLFCGSLYIISTLITSEIQVPVAIGVLTPLGGIGFILGWIFLALAVLKDRSS